MKHSHSCHSMPSVQNKIEAKTNEEEEEIIENENTSTTTNNSNHTSENLSTTTSPPKKLHSKKPISPYIVSVDSQGDTYSSPEENSPSEHSTINTEEKVRTLKKCQMEFEPIKSPR